MVLASLVLAESPDLERWLAHHTIPLGDRQRGHIHLQALPFRGRQHDHGGCHFPTQDPPEVDMTRWETAINWLVFDLYSLTPEERAIIEASRPFRRSLGTVTYLDM